MDRDEELESQAGKIIDDMLLSGSDGTLPMPPVITIAARSEKEKMPVELMTPMSTEQFEQVFDGIPGLWPKWMPMITGKHSFTVTFEADGSLIVHNYRVMSPTKTPAEPDGCNSGS